MADETDQDKRRLRHQVEYDSRMLALGLGPTTTAGTLARGEVVVEAASEVIDRGTVKRPVGVHPSNVPTPEERNQFLSNYAMSGCWNQSAYDTGHAGITYRRIAQDDPGFSLQVAEAIQDYRELIQAEIIRRGVRGVVEPVFGRGGKDEPDQIVGYVRKFSDKMLELEAKAAWPKRYRDNAVTTDGRRFGVLVVPGTASPEEWQIEARAALQRPVTRHKLTFPVT